MDINFTIEQGNADSKTTYSSFLYFPLISVAPEYFDRRRGSAMGFVLSAAGLAGLAYSLIIPVILEQIGVRWCLRIMALENLTVSVPIAFAALPSRSATRRPTLVNIRIARKPTFILQALAALLQAAGNFVPMTFTPEFSVALGYTAAFGAVLLSINNGVNAVSRILTGILADIFGRQNVLILSVVGSALSVLVLWLGAAMYNAKSLWLSFVVVYGILAGGKQWEILTLRSLGLNKTRIQRSLSCDNIRGFRHPSICLCQRIRVLCSWTWGSFRLARWRRNPRRVEKPNNGWYKCADSISITHMV